MLTRLTISNLATIQIVVLELHPGFTVLTGETGAGKSILIDALRLVLGARVDGEKLRSGERETIVEAVFNIGHLPEAQAILAEIAIPGGDELVLRRIVQGSGRSRAMANDCAITQAKLEELGQYLVNIHGQHDNQQLLNPLSHHRFLDGFGQLTAQQEEVAKLFREYNASLKRKKELEDSAARREERLDWLKKSVEELEKAALKEGEEEALREELVRLSHGERLSLLAEQIKTALYEGENALLGGMGQVAQALEEAATIDRQLAPLAEQMAPLRYQMEDLYQAVNSYSGRLEADPFRLEEINERLALLEKLKRRHGGSLEGALEALAEGRRELETLENLDQALSGAAEELAVVAEALHSQSYKLSEARKAAALRMDERVKTLLGEMGMEKAHFATRVAPAQTPAGVSPAYSSTGMDMVEFLLSTNPGQEPRPLARIASGGELSRVMLALKSVLAANDPTQTLVFDEVDQGISGAVAEQVGQKLKKLGASHQVLCITHLPQIAALGVNHLRVVKEMTDTQTFTRVVPLNGQGKVEEVARLMSGLDVSGHSLRSAEEMVKRGAAV